MRIKAIVFVVTIVILAAFAYRLIFTSSYDSPLKIRNWLLTKTPPGSTIEQVKRFIGTALDGKGKVTKVNDDLEEVMISAKYSVSRNLLSTKTLYFIWHFNEEGQLTDISFQESEENLFGVGL
jgi:hypothetical protein